MLRKTVILISLMMTLAIILGACVKKPAAVEKNLEIFSWWTAGGEAAGLNRLYGLYNAQNPAVKVVNATLSGGDVLTSTAVLESRMQGGDPPDTFQVHVGRELIDGWVVAGKMENLDGLYQSEGWDKLFPQGLLDITSYQGHYYSVPVDVHRANILWYNKQIYATLGITDTQTFESWFMMADKCKAAGLTALALGDGGGASASVNLFETILIGNLGADGYKGLWTGATPWTDPKVTTSLETFKKMLAYVNPDHSTLSWDQANQLVIDGKACTTVMVDWVDANNLAKKFTASGWTPAPNNAGVYDALSDSFGLPNGARDPNNAMSWLKLIGSKAGQEAFNPVNGSVCARTDCDPKLFRPYLQSSMQDWSKDTIVPSLAYGAAANPSWLAAIVDTINIYVTSQDVTTTQAALVKACTDAKICK
jgi:glucose/mannose transport system substrate-binding protein